ncbi:tctex1 domain-containing protein 2 [Nasonia vitripennis]|uniref:Dynein light chain n=1 Tax=Nasonia vitripennis TaxID=7425 RepID=A0A7M7Q3Z4_NASVI|nr:tctex1 domain-containing protein 2 [Nasonia vitripennis]
MESSSESQPMDNVEHEEEEDSGENVDIAEADSTNIYQISPKLDEKFKPLSAKEVIHNVLFDYLSTKEYIKDDAPTWTKEIADIIRDKIKKLEFKKYKYMVNIVLGQKNGAGLKMGTRCIWDAETDCYAHDCFTNDSLFCVAAVYAVYHY